MEFGFQKHLAQQRSVRSLAAHDARLDLVDAEERTPEDWAHGVFLATHPPVDRPHTAVLIKELLAQQD